jgi:FkbH-like protein
MKLAEALAAIQGHRPTGTPVRIGLACGFTPLHLQTFVCAALAKRFPDRPVEFVTGLYGDLYGTLAKLASSHLDAVMVVLEWSDLDPRLGIRGLGGWGPSVIDDIAETVETQTARVTSLLGAVAHTGWPLAVSLPSLNLPPVDHRPPSVLGKLDCSLQRQALAIATTLGEHRNCRIVHPHALDRASPRTERFDPKSELITGFPYTRTHAAALANLLSKLAFPRPPMKGLITDLDDTLWRGILGDDGIGALSWDLDSGSHIHALYQQLLASLAEAGVLVAVVSKNDRELVEQALARADLHIRRDQLFPVEAGWGPKSEAVSRVLESWNVDADAVVFVDDSALECAEVKSRYPAITCIRFAPHDANAAYETLLRIQATFAKHTLSEDDAIRGRSLAQSRVMTRERARASSPDAFLESLEPMIHLQYRVESEDSRPFELANKTNQFNLNGHRISEAEWVERLSDPRRFHLVVGYEDKFGPLGRIAVISGTVDGKTALVDTWAMSCRAFSRRVEFACLRDLIDKLGVDRVQLDYVATERNGPFRGFLVQVAAGQSEPIATVEKARFLASCPPLFFKTIEGQQ